MSDSEGPALSRGYSLVDGKRAAIGIAAMGFVGAGYWFLLPAIQGLIIPMGFGGAEGPWVFRPNQAFRFGATAVLSCVTLPVIFGPFQDRFRQEDASLGTRYDPFQGRRAKRRAFVFKGFAFLLIYSFGMIFYFFSWTIVGPAGIDERVPWATRHHSYDAIEVLEVIPAGERSDSIKQYGPWYSIRLRTGRRVSLSGENEGATPEELEAMARYVTDRTGLDWQRRNDSRAQ